jgi:hypothetical protein
MLASHFALKHKPYLFSSSLDKQLGEDSEAQDKAGSDLASLCAYLNGAEGKRESLTLESVSFLDSVTE